MPPVTEEQRTLLSPYIAGAQPDRRGEVEIFCPLHDDRKRSCSLNFQMGAWYCHASCGGGSVGRLIEAQEQWIPADGRVREAAPSRGPSLNGNNPTLKQIHTWHRRLMNDEDAQHELWELRGITQQTIEKAKIGHDGRYFKIPIFSHSRDLWNVRTYDTRPRNGRRKIWSVRGMGHPARIYPVGVIERAQPGDAILWCEGEWDTLLALQTGYAAITRTGSAKDWRVEWIDYFEKMRVFICQDRDVPGEEGAQLIAKQLIGIADEVRFIELPYPLKEKDGHDLTDFLLDEEQPGVALGQLMRDAKEQI